MGAPSKRTKWVELDVLRGIAGIIMVYNHAAAKWLTAVQREDPLMGALFIIGSYAPVVFFATTGIGYGIQSELPRKRGGHAFGFLRKVWILLLADALMWLSPETWIGLNFLGFIALCMLLLEPLRRWRVGWIWPLVGVVLVAALRYGVTPRLVDAVGPGQAPTMLHWLAGLGSPPGFSYPVLPWVAYALAGFSAGVLLQRKQELVLERRRVITWVVLALGVVGLAVVWWLAIRGANMMRWGTVSKVFFVSGMVALALGSGVSLLAAPSAGLAGRISLRGISSLAVVPVHYAVIAVVVWLVDTHALSSWAFAGLSTVVMAISLFLARRWDALAKSLRGRGSAWAMLVGLTALAIGLELVITDVFAHYVVSVSGQLALCCLLVVERPSST
ncbi:MAG: heparan-alpha-glucosaminide N-acetyltransferase domain-containing protein [Myxococcota bacterium]